MSVFTKTARLLGSYANIICVADEVRKEIFEQAENFKRNLDE